MMELWCIKAKIPFFLITQPKDYILKKRFRLYFLANILLNKQPHNYNSLYYILINRTVLF